MTSPAGTRATRSCFAEIAPRLVDNGWPSPLPLSGKKPDSVPGWNRYNRHPVEPQTLDDWCRRFPGFNVGHTAMAGTVGAIDNDIVDPVLAERVNNLAEELLGRTPAIRIGRAPKTLRLYRMQNVRSRKAHPIEVFADTGQFVLYGIHPDTGYPYIWLDEEPLSLSPEDLPPLTETQVESFLGEVARIIAPRAPGVGGGQVVDLDLFRRLREERAQARGRKFLRTLERQLAEASPGALHNTLLSVTGALVRCGFNDAAIRSFVRRHFSAPTTGPYADVWKQIDPAIRGARRRWTADRDARFEERVAEGLGL